MQDASKSSRGIVGFMIATFCALPFVVEFACYGSYLLTHRDWMVNFVVLSCMFAWPLLAIFAIVGLVSVGMSWTPSSRVCKAFLGFYALIIVGFAAFGFSVAGMRP